MKQKLRKTEKTWKKENKTNGSDLVKIRYQIERKTNIRDINSSSSDNEEEGVEAVVWRCSAASSVENMFLEMSWNSQSLFSDKVAGLLRNF